MANKEEYCIGCAYNTFKTKGGEGKICNGSTMKNFNRCPEWRINEAIRNDEYDGVNRLRKEI